MSAQDESKDIEMAVEEEEQSKMDAANAKKEKKKKKEKRFSVGPKTALLNDIRRNIETLEKNPNARAVTLAVRNIHKTRTKLSSAGLLTITEQFLSVSDVKVRKEFLNRFLRGISDDVEMVDENLNVVDEEEGKEDKELEEDSDDEEEEKSEKKEGVDEEEESEKPKKKPKRIGNKIEQAKADVKAKKEREEKEKKAKLKAEEKKKRQKDEKELEKAGLIMTEAELKKIREQRKAINHEVECFVHLLVLVLISDNNQGVESMECAMNLIERTRQLNFRTLDVISARAYFYWSLAFARDGTLAKIRPQLMDAYRTCCLRHDEPGQAVLINLILQNYLRYNLVDQADKFRLHVDFPVSHGGGFQYARYLYYVGRINSVQLHYSEAFNNLTQAIRKAPQRLAVGFRQQATKFMVIVQLLMGEIPERNIFGQEDLRRSLKPYFQLTQAVRVGDVNMFNAVLDQFSEIFTRDKTYNLIVRLRHNVIKTGLRNISLSYSRISIEDTSKKLGLANTQDAEYIIAKAIYDGVIDAVINRKEGYIFSKENTDIYSTNEPQAQFHKRIEFCMDVHNTAVKALRYPDKLEEGEEDKDPDVLDQDAQDLELLSELSGEDEPGDIL